MPDANQQYVVGIDLGTTNSALAVREAPREGDEDGVNPIRMLEIPQLVMPGELAPRALVPSFLYIPGEMDFPPGTLALPGSAQPHYVTGELARRRGAENPARLVASAKSWLSYAGAQRTGAILPPQAPEGVERISPVDAAAEYLRHLAAAFETAFAENGRRAPMSSQDVLLTVPASFDEEARELTVEAARRAGSIM